MTMNDYKRDFLLHLVRTGAIKFGSFRLKSGRLSPYFINIANAMRTGKDALKVADAYVKKIEEDKVKFDFIYGIAYKGISLAALIAMRYAQKGSDVRWGYNRKTEKDHGEGGMIVGGVQRGDRVLIVDDVISTGFTKLESWLKLDYSFEDIKPAGILIGIDREEMDNDYRKRFEECGLFIYSILSVSEIFDYIGGKI
ncbi:MAG: orotate phosphoribosyltransferase [Thermodesulfobacteriota bacterium]|nr:MAG: orotate phosphoribosyltransferase [Thermodesulfobacteriota bacterium]